MDKFPFHNAGNCAGGRKCVKKCAAKSWLGLGFLLSAMLGSWCCAAAAQGSVPGPFAPDQVDSGRKSFAENCAECHGKNLLGATAPALAGAEFAARWEKRTTADLYTFIRTSMPLCQGGILGNRAYADIVAYLLWANGAEPGTEDFDGSAHPALDTITGTVRTDLSKSR
jgi:mono/diheme cytochrome c family protein